MNAVTIQLQIDKESGCPSDLPIFTRSNLQEIHLAVEVLEKRLEELNLGYLRSQIFLNTKAIDRGELG